MSAAFDSITARLRALEEQRRALDEEIVALRRSVARAASGITELDTWSSEPRRRTSTEPYLRLDPAPLPKVGRPEGPAHAEPTADFDPGALRGLSDEELDGLPYGLVIVDSDGTILRYNDTESRMVGLPAERVVGLNFFRDVAPCTRVKQFEGRFREFARDARAYSVESFDFVFRFEREVQHVTIYLTPGRARGTVNISMMRRRVEPR